MKLISTAALGLAALISTQASAHFQLFYNPELAHEKGKPIAVKMPFTHPGSNGHVMDNDRPLSLQLVHKGKTKDLTDKITESSWTSSSNTGRSWELKTRLKGLGDYVYLLTPQPYYEESEDIYIQQITKTIFNVGGLPTEWNEDFNLKAEIVPLQAPYTVYAGGTFSGVVKSLGKPVPFAEIEIEYVNYQPDMNANRFSDQASHPYPNGNYETITIYADQNGTFTFGIPRAGFWGFAALNIGTDTEHNGKELSQDAVLWVQARGF